MFLSFLSSLDARLTFTGALTFFFAHCETCLSTTFNALPCPVLVQSHARIHYFLRDMEPPPTPRHHRDPPLAAAATQTKKVKRQPRHFLWSAEHIAMSNARQQDRERRLDEQRRRERRERRAMEQERERRALAAYHSTAFPPLVAQQTLVVMESKEEHKQQAEKKQSIYRRLFPPARPSWADVALFGKLLAHTPRPSSCGAAIKGA